MPLVVEAEPARLLISDIREASERATALTRQLLAFSRSQVLAPKVVPLNDLVERVKSMLSRLIGEDIRLECSLSEDTGHVRVDVGQLEQVVLNLAVNARDAMPHGGRLMLTTGRVVLDDAFAALHPDMSAGPYAVFTMTDSGGGMAPDVAARIFEPFFTTKEPGRGTGLGLSMAFGIVKQSGGHIEASSRLHEGSTFTVYLPQVAPETAVATDSSPDASSRRGHETILLVEDEDSVRRLACVALERSGYNVLCAANGSRAIEVADRHADTIDLLLTDVVMPEMRGPDLAQLLGRRRPGLKVLFISGYVQDAVERAGVAEAHFLLKPFSLKQLSDKVRGVLDGI